MRSELDHKWTGQDDAENDHTKENEKPTDLPKEARVDARTSCHLTMSAELLRVEPYTQAC